MLLKDMVLSRPAQSLVKKYDLPNWAIEYAIAYGEDAENIYIAKASRWDGIEYNRMAKSDGQWSEYSATEPGMVAGFLADHG